MKNSKNKMKAKDFWVHHVRYYDGSAIAVGVVDVQATQLQGKSYIELICSNEDDAKFLCMASIEEELLGLPDDLYVVMIDPNGYSGEHQYVTGSSDGRYEITYHCSND